MVEIVMSHVKLSWQLRLILRLERLALPVWRWVLNKRLKKGKETQVSFDQKLMLHLPSAQHTLPLGTPLIWGHAVGVGEVLGLLGLFRRLSEHLPMHHFLLTSTSRTSGEALERQKLSANFHHQFAPVDHPDVMKRFLDAWQPQLACWSETDLWPCMVLATHERSIPMLMFNARVNAEKTQRMRRLDWFYLSLMRCFERIYAQNLESKNFLSQLGLDSSLAQSAGNIKALAPALFYDRQALEVHQAKWKQRPIWLLASSHLSEEEVALQAHLLLRQTHQDALLIIVPRDAFRGAEIQAMVNLHVLHANLRSNSLENEASCDVYIADTMGELGLWYALSPVALIGGSLVPIGGHNPYEAIAAQCRVLSGPMTENFSESYEALLAAGLAQTVTDAHAIFQAVLSSWQRERLPHDAYIAAHELLKDILIEIKQQTAR
jgi:3-deoxy-D-manno-octulosonic-acid transferase